MKTRSMGSTWIMLKVEASIFWHRGFVQFGSWIVTKVEASFFLSWGFHNLTFPTWGFIHLALGVHLYFLVLMFLPYQNEFESHMWIPKCLIGPQFLNWFVNYLFYPFSSYTCIKSSWHVQRTLWSCSLVLVTLCVWLIC